MTVDFEALAAPFEPSELEWRVGSKTKKGDKSTLLVYLTARAVMARLDAVAGPAGWRDAYTPLFDGGRIAGYLCELSLEVEPGRWVSKVDGADVTDIEAIKGGISSALKRAASKWLVGRYLYDVDSRWHPIKEGYGPDDKSVYCPMGPGKDGPAGHVMIPQLPDWALPKEPKKRKAKGTVPETTPEHQQLADELAAERAKREEAERKAKHHPSWDADRASWCAAVQYHGLNPDIAMDVIAKASKGVRPSAMDTVRRAKALQWLTSPDGALAYDAAIAEREREAS